MVILPISLEAAQKFMASRGCSFTPVAKAAFCISVRNDDTLHGVIVIVDVDGEAALNHAYSDGLEHGYSILYGAAWKAAKALGYKRIIL